MRPLASSACGIKLVGAIAKERGRHAYDTEGVSMTNHAHLPHTNTHTHLIRTRKSWFVSKRWNRERDREKERESARESERNMHVCISARRHTSYTRTKTHTNTNTNTHTHTHLNTNLHSKPKTNLIYGIIKAGDSMSSLH
jgi:hypothetical protein